MIDENRLIDFIDAGKFRNPDELHFSENDVVRLIKNFTELSNELKLNEQPKADWIPCEVAMPEEGQIVLICQSYGWTEFEENEVTIAQYRNKCFTWYRYQGDWSKHTSISTHGDICPGNEYVSAWQPLPQPYKKEGAENGIL